ncbi:MAG: hypothetical protein ACQEWG_04660 [Bacteroidota bacterium]
MQFLKVLGLLFFLVISNQAFALAIYEEHFCQKDSSDFPQVQEKSQGLGESILTELSNLPVFQPISAFSKADFVFRGFNSVTKANGYLRYAATIKPGLDNQKIIFPFHTFL